MHIEGTDENKNASDTPKENIDSTWKQLRITSTKPARVYRKNDLDDYIALLKQGTIVACVGQNDKYYFIKFGGIKYDIARIEKKNAEIIPTKNRNKLSWAIDIAKSMANVNYENRNIGITGKEWCVQWLYYLLKATGCKKYPDFNEDAKVSKVPKALKKEVISPIEESTNKLVYPNPGDFIIYSKNGEKFYHIGLVTAVVNGEIYTVEGNLNDTIKEVQFNLSAVMQPDSNIKIGENPFKVQGYITPDWD